MATMEQKIEENIFMARICEQTNRFEDMVDFLKIVIETKGGEMTLDERTMISVAYKNAVATKRTTWRTVVSVRDNPKYLLYIDSLNEYKKKLEDALYAQCMGIIDLVQKNVLAKPCDDEAKAFFLKLVADNHRYIAEMSTAARYR